MSSNLKLTAAVTDRGPAAVVGNGFKSPAGRSPIAIAGMHRSGTSLIAALMYRCGLFLGTRDDLMPPSPDNEDGYWENVRFLELNEEVLRAAGGGWDDPPASVAIESADVADVLGRARVLAAEFDSRLPWAWKDPRNTLTLPFWIKVIPDLRVVACIRNPLEVALSLHRRNDFSYERSLALWLLYNRHLREAVPGNQLVLTHYDAYFGDPVTELSRVVRECGLTVANVVLEQACAAVRPDLHHNRFTATDLINANVSGDILSLYQELCDQAGRRNEGRFENIEGDGATPRRPLNRSVIDSFLMREAVGREPSGGTPMRPAVESAEAGPRHVTRRSEALDHDAKRLSAARLKARNALKRSKTQIAQSAKKATEDRQAIEYLEAEVRSLRGQIRDQATLEEAMQALSQRQEAAIEELRARIRRLKGELAIRPTPARSLTGSDAEAAVEHLQSSLDDAVTRVQRTFERLDRSASAHGAAADRVRYADARDRMGEAIAECVPLGATVLIASKGDENLLRIPGRRAWHFPRAQDGTYSWSYPADSGSAIAQLEALRAQGADYLIFPATSLWWMTHYAGFRRHIERYYRQALADKEVGVVFSLRAGAGNPRATKQVVANVIAQLEEVTPSPAMLDWTRTAELRAEFREQIVFSPIQITPPLPYLDDSADVVVVRQADGATLKEARRIASSAVVKVNGSGFAEVEWLDRIPISQSTIAIVVASDGSNPDAKRCLDALVETVPATDKVSFTIVGCTDLDPLQAGIGALKMRGQNVLVLGSAGRRRLLPGMNQAARRVRSELLVFVHADTVPVQGWFQPLVRTLEANSKVGVSGGKMVLPDGRLRAAGGALLSDGSFVDIGRFEQRVDAPVFSHAREVDYCSASLMGTRRKLFLDLGGFDTSLKSGADVDYCLRVWGSGHSVVYEPESLVVQFESGDDEAAAEAETTLRSRWKKELKLRPYPPARLDMQAWMELAVLPPRLGQPA